MDDVHKPIRAPVADFEAVFRASPRPMLLMAADAPRFTMVAVNDAHARAFGTTPDALRGYGVFEVFPATPDPVTAEFMQTIQTSLNRVLETRAADQMPVQPYALPTADGGLEERYWSADNTPILGPEGEVLQILSAVQDVTAEANERRSEEARGLLMREVDHRARNALTVVQSVVRLTAADDIAGFKQVVLGRVEALARAQTSLARRRWEGADLAEVIGEELASLASGERYRLSGPPLLLRAEHVQAMSMVLHELATNATKYGALSMPRGAVSIDWSTPSAGQLALAWRETGGPPVTAPQGAGFGSRLIAQLSRQLGGEAQYDWRPDGLVVRLSVTL